MAKECFCGCGRKVPFGRKRIANGLGHRLTEDIAHFQGAVDRTPDPEHDDDLRRLITTGIPLRDKLAGLIHGTFDRDDYPREDGQRWLEDAQEHRKRLAQEAIDGDYAGWNAHKQSYLVRAGVAAQAKIVDVSDTGMTLNDDPRVEVTLRVDPPDGAAPFELKRKLIVSRVNVPRPGEHVTVFYDPKDPNDFTFRNADVTDGDKPAPAESAPTLDPVDQIAKLADLRDKGALSDDEFAQAKQRLLAGL